MTTDKLEIKAVNPEIDADKYRAERFSDRIKNAERQYDTRFRMQAFCFHRL
jgi:hypothetical protein